MMSLASIPCAVIPMLGFLWFIWWLDRYDREPVWLFLGVFAWGAVGAVFLALAGNGLAAGVVNALAAGDTVDALSMTFVAPLVEEPSKALILLFVARSRHFDNATDGFVYGAAAGLGFGMSENLLYFINVAATGDPAAWLMTVVVRTLYSALMHAGATSLIGAAMGVAKFRRGIVGTAVLSAGVAAAMAMHAVWNGLLSLAQDGAGLLGVLNFALFPLEFLVLVAVFQGCLVFEHRMLRRELEEEAKRGTLPMAHVQILSSYRLRWRRGWLPPAVNHHKYVRMATTLALRRSQLGSGRDTPFYEQELRDLRAKIPELLQAGGVQGGHR